MSSSSSNIQCPRRMPHLCISSIMKCYFNKIFHLSIIHKRDRSWGIRWIFVVLSCLFLTINANMQQVEQCMVFPTAGWTVPKGEIFVKYGDNLQIWCNLNETFIAKEYSGTYNSSNILFIRDNATVEQKFVTTINETTALLTIESPPAGQFNYFCKLDVLGIFRTVCLNKVVVAYESQRAKNFTCRSYNWKNIICTWNVSQHYVPTTYKLLYIIHTTERQELVSCPTEKATNNSCTWTQHTYPTYKQTKEEYNFIMYIHNMFGTKCFEYDTIDHFAIVIPGKPKHVSVINETSNSATLCWEIPFTMNNFPPGLTHKVMYMNHRDHEKKWKIINIDTEPHLYKRCYTLTRLHANTEYDAHIYLRSAKAVEENMYSEPAVTIFKTLPTIPSFPPRTDIGSFEIVENNGNRDVYVYWQMIQQRYENGNQFRYWINYVEESNHQTYFEPIEVTKTYAKFEGLSFNKYRFEIYSENEVDINKNYTEIIVPNQVPHGPIEFTIMAFENGLYELSWVPPMIHEDFTNYTIFWCDSKHDRPYQCTGYLNWTHVPMNITVYNITVPDSNKLYQFAISVNTNNGSSGMTWSSCTVIRSKKIDKIKFIWINRVGLDFIEVGWKLDCLDRIGVIEEIKIYYCPIESVLNTNCKEPKLNISVKYHPYKIHGIVKNLMAFTTYKLELTMVTKYGESQPKSLFPVTTDCSIKY